MAANIDFKKIQWEDEDTGFESDRQKKHDEVDEFSKLLEEDTSTSRVSVRIGAQIQGTISHIPEGSNDVIVELDRHSSGVIDRIQLCDENGQLKFREGDVINAYVVSNRGGEIQLSTSLGHSHQVADDLINAFKNQVPVKGKVIKDNKGGFEVTILGKPAFCPVSQMDRRFVADKTQYIGKEFNFLIEKYEERGRNIVVSRAKLLNQEAELRRKEIEASLGQDIIYDGVVTDIRDYGAFVDIGGVDGFLHISEMSHSRVSRVSDFLQRGDKIRVKVTKVDQVDGKSRISLSMKAVEADPWGAIQDEFKSGSTYTGRVTRLETFGAFVELRPGIEGLVHISEMSWEKRIHHPSDIVKVGDSVQVRILDIDTVKQKISLSLKAIDADPWLNITSKYPATHACRGKVERLKDFGAIIELEPGVTGMVPMGVLKKAFGETYRKHCSPPQVIDVTVVQVDVPEKKILLSLPNVKGEDDADQDYREYLNEQKAKADKTPAPKATGSFGALLAEKLKEKRP